MASEDKIVLFTDGACSGNPGPGGWGAILVWNGLERELNGGEHETTNNRMELMGAIMGMNHFPVDLPRLVDFYMRGLLDLDTIIAERIPLERINEGFEKMKGGHSARSVVVFD